MINCFLNKQRFFLLYCIFNLLILNAYTQNVNEKNDFLSINECEKILSEYHKTNIIDIDILFDNLNRTGKELFDIFNLQNTAEKRNIEKENQLLISYLEYAKIISTVYVFGGINKYAKRVKKIETDIEFFIKKSKPDSDIYLKLADYMYTKISLPKNFNIISTLPVLYRKTLLLAHNKNEAIVKSAWWHIAAANQTTSNFCGFIENAEEYIEELNENDKFMSYIWYSIYYMKKYNSKKGWEYFNKAAVIFPKHIWLTRLYANYTKGILGL